MINNSLQYSLTNNYFVQLEKRGIKQKNYLLFRKIPDPLEDGLIEVMVRELNEEELKRLIVKFYKKESN